MICVKIMRLILCLFFQAQMVRRVKAYLKSIKVIVDEDELHKMSVECEPPVGGLPANPHHATSQVFSEYPFIYRVIPVFARSSARLGFISKDYGTPCRLFARFYNGTV